MSKHKKQHYIPKCYLKAWCDPSCPPKHEPYVWIFPKEERAGKRKAPENIFHETDMYTLWDEQGERNLHIEHSLSSLESEFSKLRAKKLAFQRDLTIEERAILITFLSAMHVRTKSQLSHISDQWQRPLEMMDELAEKMKTATIEEKKRMASLNVPSSSNDRGSFSHDQVRKMVDDPVGTMMIPALLTESKLLAKLDMAILTSKNDLGFITSDCPCVWYDPEAYKRPPFYRAPALMYETIEITMPISPSQCILLNRQGISGYIEVSDEAVETQNRLIRFDAEEFYVANANESHDVWFDPGVEPDDSWEKQQEKKKANN